MTELIPFWNGISMFWIGKHKTIRCYIKGNYLAVLSKREVYGLGK